MMKVVIVCVLGFMLAGSFAKDKPECEAPKELSFNAFVSKWGEPFRARFYVEYDKPNQRVVMFGDEHKGHVQRYQEFLFLHRDNVGYDINFEEKTCKKFSVGKFHPYEVPANSSYEGQFDIGGPQNTVTVERWSLKLDSGREYFHQDVTLRHCYPVSQFLADEKNFNQSTVTDIFDLTVGIVNPDGFHVPDLCRQGAPGLSAGPITPAANRAMSLYTYTLYN